MFFKIMRMLTKVFILLIGMISFTAVSSTPLPDRKPTAFTDVNIVPTVLVDVLFTADTCVFVFSQIIESDFSSLKIVKPTFAAVITDVGWQRYQQLYNYTFYKEKLLPEQNKNTRQPPNICRSNC